MGFLTDSELLSLLEQGSLKVEPFVQESLSCSKLDLRIGDEIVRLKNTDRIFDIRSKNDYSEFFQYEKKQEFIIYPDERALLCTIEKLQLPLNVIGIVGLRSGYSRLGLRANIGLVDPGFAGQLTLEITGSCFPVRLYAGEKVFHITFASLGMVIVKGYAGKYQDQKGPTLPRFDNSDRKIPA